MLIHIILQMLKVVSGICSPLKYSVVSNDSVLGEWRSWLDCANVQSLKQSDLGLNFPHVPGDMFSHDAAHLINVFRSHASTLFPGSSLGKLISRLFAGYCTLSLMYYYDKQNGTSHNLHPDQFLPVYISIFLIILGENTVDIILPN